MKLRLSGFCLIVVAIISGQVKGGDTEYPFKKSPIEILEAIKSLPFPGPEPTFSPGEAEAQLIEWFRKGELTERQWVEAFLIADGVSKADDRLTLLKEFEKSADQLQIETKGMPLREKGDHILRFLHNGSMSGGFERDQATFAGLLRTAKFNCNASTIMFHLHAKRLGLKVQPAEFTGEHILDLVILDDKIIDVETTSPDGFDSRVKNSQSQDDLKRTKRLTDTELLFTAFGNRTREAYRKDAKADVLRLLVVMLAIAPDNVDIQNGVEGSMVGWTYALHKDGRHKDAMEVGRTAVEIAPNSSGIKNNLRSALCTHAQSLIENGKAEEAVILLMDSKSRWPDEKYAEEIPFCFCRAAIATVKTKGWGEAFQIVERGVKECPEDKWLPRVLVTELKEKLGDIDSNQGVKAAGEWAAKMRKDFPNATEIPIANGEHVKEISRNLSSQKKFAQAREAIVERAAMLSQPLVEEMVGIAVYDEARALADQNQWQKATYMCIAELKNQPKNELLSTNAQYFLHRWARVHIDKEEWNKAVEVYQEGLKLFPNDSTLKQNLEYYQDKLK